MSITSKIQESGNYQIVQNFNPFPRGFDKSDAQNFKKTFVGMEEILYFGARPLADHTRKFIDMERYATKAKLQEEDEKENIDIEIRTQFEDRVSTAFDQFLNRSLDPAKELSTKKLQAVKDRITALFSSKALTALTTLDQHLTEECGGMLMDSTPLKQRCELFISPGAVQIIARLQMSYCSFYDLTSKELVELPRPIIMDAQIVHTIDRKANVHATAAFNLRFEKPQSLAADHAML